MWEERISSSVAKIGNRIAVYESPEPYLTTGPGIKEYPVTGSLQTYLSGTSENGGVLNTGPWVATVYSEDVNLFKIIIGSDNI